MIALGADVIHPTEREIAQRRRENETFAKGIKQESEAALDLLRQCRLEVPKQCKNERRA